MGIDVDGSDKRDESCTQLSYDLNPSDVQCVLGLIFLVPLAGTSGLQL